MPWKNKIDISIHGRQYLIQLALFLGAYSVILAAYPRYQNFFFAVKFPRFDFFIPFAIYALLAVFTLLRWKEINRTKFENQSRLQTVAILLVALFLFCFPLSSLNSENQVFNYLLTYSIFYLCSLTLFFSTFGMSLVSYFKVETSLILGFYLVYFIYHTITILYWRYLSFLIVWLLSKIFWLINIPINLDFREFHISLMAFNVRILPPCAGFDSLAIFSLLFVASLIMASQTAKILYRKAALAWLAGIVVTFLLNVTRVAVIVLVGGYWSPALAMKLFHEYLAAFFVIILFTLYLNYILPKIIARKED